MKVINTITEFNDFFDFNYHALYPNNLIFDFFAQPWVPFLAVFLYVTLSKPVVNILISLFGIKPDNKLLKAGIILHSGILAVYSGWTFFNSVVILMKYYNEVGGSFYGVLCGSRQSLWVEYNMSFWITHFYISKYYEFIDTWIVLFKGRQPMFLQTYHHAGVVIIMWGLSVTYCTPVIVLVVLNSFIHTLMYTYYTASAFGYSSPLKHYLTSLQILQFVVGISFTIPTHWLVVNGISCITPAGSIALLVLQIYTVILIFLFGQFYIQSYTKKGTKKDIKKKD